MLCDSEASAAPLATNRNKLLQTLRIISGVGSRETRKTCSPSEIYGMLTRRKGDHWIGGRAYYL